MMLEEEEEEEVEVVVGVLEVVDEVEVGVVEVVVGMDAIGVGKRLDVAKKVSMDEFERPLQERRKRKEEVGRGSDLDHDGRHEACTQPAASARTHLKQSRLRTKVPDRCLEAQL